jgi:hypothetical protein
MSAVEFCPVSQSLITVSMHYYEQERFKASTTPFDLIFGVLEESAATRGVFPVLYFICDLEFALP